MPFKSLEDILETPTPSRKLLQSWDARRQQAYRDNVPQEIFHLVLDKSTSMDTYAQDLCEGYNYYLGWLKTHASLAMLRTIQFSTHVHLGPVEPMAAVPYLSGHSYQPGGLTALYEAVGLTAQSAGQTGQHFLVCLTDGHENCSPEHWPVQAVRAMLELHQQEAGWICVYLGTGQASLAQGVAMGFPIDNCLIFPSRDIPKAWERVLQGTRKFLAAPPAERKLLVQHFL